MNTDSETSNAAATPATRSEHDLIGDREVPASAYYGVHTLRALENFPITGQPISIYPDLVRALALVKRAAAKANWEVGQLDETKAKAIIAACEEIEAGALHGEFVVDVIQGGAGTSTNMNANEVIANRALELLGHARGEYAHLHPNDHVNLGQSTNDVYPTALRLAARFMVARTLEAMRELRGAFEAKAKEFAPLLKMGRTQLQDAVPMTLGQEFQAFANTLADDERRLAESVVLMDEHNMGATAIGTGINTHPDYTAAVCRHLAQMSGLPLHTAKDLIAATPDCGDYVHLSGLLKRFAVRLSKTCNDLRLLSSGPRAGLGEINLPAAQAGSSIMPGKVNPVIPEVVNQIAFEVIGNDVTVTMAAEAGQLQLNAFEPIIAHSLYKSAEHLRQGCLTLSRHCVSGITANVERLDAIMKNTTGIVTAFSPYIGYERSTQLAKEALRTGRGVYELMLEKGWLPREEIERILRPENLTRPSLAQRGR